MARRSCVLFYRIWTKFAMQLDELRLFGSREEWGMADMGILKAPQRCRSGSRRSKGETCSRSGLPVPPLA